MVPRSRAPLPADDPLPPQARPASEAAASAETIQGTVMQMIGDLTGVARWLPGASREDADRAALLLSALAAECAEAASMCWALGTGPEASL